MDQWYGPLSGCDDDGYYYDCGPLAMMMVVGLPSIL